MDSTTCVLLLIAVVLSLLVTGAAIRDFVKGAPRWSTLRRWARDVWDALSGAG